jgi:hypothetical protein
MRGLSECLRDVLKGEPLGFWQAEVHKHLQASTHSRKRHLPQAMILQHQKYTNTCRHQHTQKKATNCRKP